MIRTANGGRAACGLELDHENTTRAERLAILEREARLKEWRRSLPRKKKPESMRPGPVTIIQLQR